MAIEQVSEFLSQNLPANLRALLTPLILHDLYVDLDYLEEMARRVPPPLDRAQINQFARTLEAAQLLLDCGQSIYQIGPSLATALHAQELTGAIAWARAFVTVMGSVSEALAARTARDQQGPFQVYARNFYSALKQADPLKMEHEATQLTRGLASWAKNSRNLEEAERLYAMLTKHPAYRADAYHQLGCIALEKHNHGAAAEWFRMSLAISEPADNRPAMANTYHQMGIIAREKRDLTAAEELFRKSIAIHQSQGDDDGAASTYHQLGMVYELRDDVISAERWYYRALATKEKSGDEDSAAAIYHQLGVLAQRKGDIATAERWYNKSLTIKERLGNETGAAPTYHQMGMLALQKEDWLSADNWFRKSLSIAEKSGDAQLAAANSLQLGLLTVQQGQLVSAGRWLVKAIQVFRSTDPASLDVAVKNFLQIRRQAALAEKTQMEELWRAAKLGPMPQ
ncbi:MAG: tetratricopeptide repeat protein [Acidobacteriia bacterium]|nr:tetratricopeptide repeat protein [Terriglobia bacterium]